MKFARQHRFGTMFVVAAALGVVLGLTHAPFWVVLVAEIPFIMIAVPWVMLGREKINS